MARALLLRTHFFIDEGKTIESKAQGGRRINLDNFASFVKERIDVVYQMDDSNVHIKKLRGCLEMLAGT